MKQIKRINDLQFYKWSSHEQSDNIYTNGDYAAHEVKDGVNNELQKEF